MCFLPWDIIGGCKARSVFWLAAGPHFPMTYLFRLYCDIQLLMRISIFHKPIYIICLVPPLYTLPHLSFWTLLTLNSICMALIGSLPRALWSCFCPLSFSWVLAIALPRWLSVPLTDLVCPIWSYSLPPSYSDRILASQSNGEIPCWNFWILNHAQRNPFT